MKKLTLSMIALVAVSFVSSTAFARVQTDDPTCSHPCTAAEKTAGTCHDYRRPDNTCYQVRGTVAQPTPAPTAPPTSNGSATKLSISILNETADAVTFRGIASNSAGRVNGATVQCRRGTQTNKRNWGHVRTTAGRGTFTVGGPKDSASPCYICNTGTVRSNQICLK